MAYDQSKDKLIKLIELKKDNSSLLCSIFSYDGGESKLRITRCFEKKDGSTGYAPSGGLNIEEIDFLKNNIVEIIKIMKG